MVCRQNCVVLVAPQPYNPAPADSFQFRTQMDFSGGGHLWYARSQLFFRYTACPTGSLHHPRQHKELALVFFSTFESDIWTSNVVLQRNGVPMVYVDSMILLAALTFPTLACKLLG